MSSKRKKILLILTGIILLISFSPITYFNARTNIETNNKKNHKHYGSTTKHYTYKKGISFNEKENELENDGRFKVTKSSMLNFGIYSIFAKEISFERVINNETVKTLIKAESEIWGLGQSNLKKNNFNDIIKDRIDEIYLEN
ncbi:hypothetical protein [Mariniflexile sp. AS56]|uniref:hypothetical protein n=1 Tax=Mariniflexile sp. AS56 TaxID=3063957 RepID=UPI0026EAE06C|nr:hypothetical protein [Mariniflexile sp. AS56]MDO7172525.1 hypothetical protein [Mariniflexile sp. AS56]